MEHLTITMEDIQQTFKKLEDYIKDETPRQLNMTEKELQIMAHCKTLAEAFPKDKAIKHYNKIIDRAMKKMGENIDKLIMQLLQCL